MKPTEPIEPTNLEKLHADLIADDKWTMPPRPTQELQPQPPEASLPAPPETSENLPAEPVAEDEGMTPEESQPPLAPVEDVP